MTEIFRLESISLCEIGVFNNLQINFKPIESQEEDEKKAEIHLFTGSNGSGKSTILYAIAEIFNSFSSHKPLIRTRYLSDKSRVDYKFGGSAGSYGVNPPKPDETNSIVTPYGNAVLRLNDPNRGNYNAIEESIEGNKLFWYKNKSDNYQIDEKLSQTKFEFAAFAYSGTRTLSSEALNSGIQEIHASPFEYALSFNNTVRANLLNQWIANNRAQAALALQDKDIQAAKEYDLLLKAITDLIKEICDIEIKFSLQRSPLEVKLQLKNKTVRFEVLPDGLKSIISWVADLILRLDTIPWTSGVNILKKPIILMLDEIDIHLHPKWQRKILPAVQKLLPNAQIFVSTHSPFVVGSVEDAWVYSLPENSDSTKPLIVEGVHSGAGKSYALILNETFNINEEFDIESEKLSKEFYLQRKTFIESQKNLTELTKSAKLLADRGKELKQIVNSELRQISRITDKEIPLA